MKLTDLQASNLTRGNHFFKFWMPYLFQKIVIPDTKWAYLPLNRIYKPLGQIDRGWVDYNSFGLSHGVAFSADPAAFKGIWSQMDDEDRLWLYEDPTSVRKTYFTRLEALMKKSFKTIVD